MLMAAMQLGLADLKIRLHTAILARQNEGRHTSRWAALSAAILF